MTKALKNPNPDVITDMERQHADLPPEVTMPEGAKRLTDEEWKLVLPPFYYAKVNFPEWGEMEYEIAVKWAEKNSLCGWFYYRESKHVFIFETMEDYAMFRMWVDKRPMHSESYEVK